MKKLWNSLKAAVFTYSIIPTPRFKRDKEQLQYVLYFVPAVGLLIGLLITGWTVGAPYLFNYSFMTASICAVVPVVVSKASTLDGFFRTVDALSSHKSKDGKLAILQDSHSGYFSIITCICYFLISVGIWSEMPLEGLPILAFSFVLSRALYVFSIVTMKHSTESKCSPFMPYGANRGIMAAAMVLFMLYSGYGMIGQNVKVGIAACVGAAVAYLYYYYIARKHFGGITEDVAGFFVHVCELLMPLCALLVYRLPLSGGGFF